jgi:hypothetical protein
VLPHPSKKRTTLFWVLSIILHLALLGALIRFTPLRTWLFEVHPADPAMPEVDQRRIDELVNALREKYHRQLAESLQRLRVTFAEMDRLQNKRFEQLKASDPQLIDRAPPPLPALAEFAPGAYAIEQLYRMARDTEGGIIDAYERVRAFDMAGRQYVRVSQSLVNNQIARPDRATLNVEALQAPITNMRDGRFEAFKREMSNADLEAKAMVAFTERLLLLAKGVMGEDTSLGIIQWEVAGLDTAGAAETAFDEGKPYVGATLLPHEMFRVPEAAGTWRGGAVFGRKVAEAGSHAEWMSVDNWWYVGPFAHPGRQNLEDLDKKYPPEDVVDLGAVYVGKEGRRIGWKYRQTRFIRIEPYGEDFDRYAIWYFYTEIYSDRDQELWVAFGSDDYGKAWVEGKLVWASGKQVKPWGPGQDYRKIQFRQGHNRMLVKLENAGGTTGLSVILSLDPTL